MTNTGNVTLHNISVTDDHENITLDCGNKTNIINNLDVGKTTTCVAFGIAQLGQYDNLGTASALFTAISRNNFV